MCTRVERSLFALVVGAALVPGALAWEPIQWSQGAGHWEYDDLYQQIYIYEPGLYYFYATTGGAQGPLAEINGIYVAEEIEDEVRLVVLRDPNYGGGPGCTLLGGLDISDAMPGVLAECRVVGDVGTLANIQCDTLLGPFEAGGDVEHAVHAGALEGEFACQYLLAELLAPLASAGAGSIYVRASATAPITLGPGIGAVTIDGDLLAPLTVLEGQGVAAGGVAINGDCRAGVAIHGQCGYVNVGGDVASTVTVDGWTAGFVTLGTLAGSVDLRAQAGLVSVEGDVTGTMRVAESVQGNVVVLGSVQNGGIVEVGGGARRVLIGWDVSGVVKVVGSVFDPGGEEDLMVGGSVNGQLAVHGNIGPSSVGGSVYGTLDLLGALTGPFTVFGSVFGHMRVGEVPYGVTLLVGGGVHGDLRVLDQVQGTVHVQAGVRGTLTLEDEVRGSIVAGVEGQTFDSPGLIELLSDCTTCAIDVRGRLYDPVAGTSGAIHVYGSLGLGSPQNARISVAYPFRAAGEGTEHVAIDYDGYQASDRWRTGSTVVIGIDPNTETFTGNAPAARIFEIASCKGDIDNDGAVDYYDIDPLIDAFGDGAAYNAAFPGLSASRVFHGDLDCSGTVDFYDIDPFIARLGTCTPECYEYDNMQGGGEGQQMQMMGGGAAAIAAQLAASVSAENMPALIAAIEQLALDPPANSAIDWSAVLAALAGI